MLSAFYTVILDIDFKTSNGKLEYHFTIYRKCPVSITQEKINQCHHMGNAWVSPSIPHITGKCNNTHRME